MAPETSPGADPGLPDHPFRDDLELVRRSLHRDPAIRRSACEQLFERLRCVPRMLAAKNAALGGVLDAHELEDVAQETLLALWRRRDRYEGRASLESWAWSFCYFNLMNRVRRWNRRIRTAPVEPVDVDRNTGFAPDYDFVHKALAELEPPVEDVVRLKHFERLSFTQIGAVLRISPNTAKSRYYKGLDRLRRLLVRHRVELEP